MVNPFLPRACAHQQVHAGLKALPLEVYSQRVAVRAAAVPPLAALPAGGSNALEDSSDWESDVDTPRVGRQE